MEPVDAGELAVHTAHLRIGPRYKDARVPGGVRVAHRDDGPAVVLGVVAEEVQLLALWGAVRRFEPVVEHQQVVEAFVDRLVAVPGEPFVPVAFLDQIEFLAERRAVGVVPYVRRQTVGRSDLLRIERGVGLALLRAEGLPPLGGGFRVIVGYLRGLDAHGLHRVLDVLGGLRRRVMAERVGEDVAVQLPEGAGAVVARLVRGGQGVVHGGTVLREQPVAVGDELLGLGILAREVRGRPVAHPALVVDVEAVLLRPPHRVAQIGLGLLHPEPGGVEDLGDGHGLRLDHADARLDVLQVEQGSVRVVALPGPVQRPGHLPSVAVGERVRGRRQPAPDLDGGFQVGEVLLHQPREVRRHVGSRPPGRSAPRSMAKQPKCA
ncbi:hypothetical protein [Streptomyces nigra]|uniref:hypothetical protein n=1 Tax=Streptomyces nigra TaxID=1827580 RepID=UPI0035D5FF50